MPIGSSYSNDGAPLPVFPGAQTPVDPGTGMPTSSQGCAGCGTDHLHFWQLLTASPVEASALTGTPGLLPMAELPAPPAGYQYVIERAIVRGPSGALGIYVIVGDLNLDNLVDGIPSSVADFAVMADGESAIRVPPGQPLRFVWLGSTTDRFTARVQYRQEAA
jgi:hypothetical protein